LATAHSQRAVLFVDICDSTQLYETLGDDVAAKRVAGCLESLGKQVDEAGGRVVQRIGDELMCVYPSAASALECARGMQEWIMRRALRAKPALAIRIGCHFGPVLEKAADLFGDSVNVAARAAAMAKAGQVLTTGATVTQLDGPLREGSARWGIFRSRASAKTSTSSSWSGRTTSRPCWGRCRTCRPRSGPAACCCACPDAKSCWTDAHAWRLRSAAMPVVT